MSIKLMINGVEVIAPSGSITIGPSTQTQAHTIGTWNFEPVASFTPEMQRQLQFIIYELPPWWSSPYGFDEQQWHMCRCPPDLYPGYPYNEDVHE